MSASERSNSPASPAALRVLHIGKFFDPFHGGMENFLRDLMHAQKAQGYETAVLVHHHQVRRGFVHDRQDGLDVYRVPMHAKLVFAPLSPSFGYHLRCIIEEFRPQLLHLHLPNVSAFWALFLPICRQIPWVLHWHADVVASSHHRLLPLAYRFYAPFERRLLRQAQRIIVTSPPYLGSSEPLRPFQDKCSVVPLGLSKRGRSTQESSADPDPWPAKDGLRVLSIGRLTYYKGHEILIEAVARTPGVQALIVGEGDRQAALQGLIAASVGAEHIRLSGSLEKSALAALLAHCDCVCLPSIERTEAFGLVLLEAMQAGKACIVTAVKGSGMGWVVEHGKTGLVVQPQDPIALAEALAWARDNRAALKRLGEEGYAKFTADFSIEAVSHKIDELYRQLLPSRPENVPT